MSKQSIYFHVEELTSPSDVKKIKKGVDMLHGVISVSVNYDDARIAVDYDSTGTNGDEIRDEIEKMGYPADLIRHEDHTM